MQKVVFYYWKHLKIPKVPSSEHKWKSGNKLFLNDQVFMRGGFTLKLKDFPLPSSGHSLNYLDGRLIHCGGRDTGKCYVGTFNKDTMGNY